MKKLTIFLILFVSLPLFADHYFVQNALAEKIKIGRSEDGVVFDIGDALYIGVPQYNYSQSFIKSIAFGYPTPYILNHIARLEKERGAVLSYCKYASIKLAYKLYENDEFTPLGDIVIVPGSSCSTE